MVGRLVCAVALLLAAVSGFAASEPLVLFVAGEPSHGPGEHRFPEGCRLLAKALDESAAGVRAQVSFGWPEAAVLETAGTLVIYSDGLDRHVANGHVDELRRHISRGGGLVVLHFAVEPSPGPLADFLLESLGGRFEVDWSVNPVWTLERPILGGSEVTRGVAPFSIEDEWYYHLRFRDGITPVLSALPPESSLGEDGPRAGNAAVRAEIARGEPQVLAWTFSENGRRAFGFTGGHFHRSWANDDFRNLVLNGIAWTAGVEIPPDGIESAVPPQPRYATLDEAIARGDLDDVRRHLAISPLRVHGSSEATLSPVHQAILRNRTEIARLLIASGADVDQPDRSRRTPLHLAVERGNLEVLQTLLERGARPNEHDKIGWTPLHHAAAKDRIEIARALLRGGANPMTLSERGGTPLHEAAASGGAEMVQLLLDAGVDPTIVSKTGVTALDVAREFGNEPAIALLAAAKR